MTALDRKLLRDLYSLAGQAIAIAAVIASGVTLMVAQLSVEASLKLSRDTYYARYRFAHVFAQCKRAPKSLEAQLAQIEGVSAVQTRTVLNATLDVRDFDEPIVGRLLSMPADRRPALNDVHLRAGRYLEPLGAGEALISEGFALAHGLKPGDTLRALINGRKRELAIVGIALSPEYVYAIRPGDFLPDEKRYAIVWMDERELSAAFDMQGAFNDVSLSLARDADERRVIADLDELLKPYGGLGAIGRRHQVSHAYLENELNQLQSMAYAFPSIFLGVAAFLLNVVLSRIIAAQREQIAALKAFGYSNFAVGMHYAKLVVLISVLGAAGGVALGIRMGVWWTGIYTDFFRIPFLEFALNTGVVIWALILTLGSCLAGAWFAVRQAASLPPAEAMRPPSPGRFGPTIPERLGLAWLVGPSGRMILRSLERRPLKSLLSVLGVAMAASVFVLGFYFLDVIDHVMDVQFNVIQREDMVVGFNQSTRRRALREIERMPGVYAAEPFRSVPVRLVNGHNSRYLGIEGIQPDGIIHRVLNADLREVQIPEEGLLLSRKLAEILDVRVGQSLSVEVLEGARPTYSVPVTALVDDFLGLSATMELSALNRLMREGPVISGAYVIADPLHEQALYQRFKNTPGVATVSMKSAGVKAFRDTMAQTLWISITFNVIFAGVIAFGVVYNTARILLAERERELASLRVLGFTRAEISGILLGELAVITLVAIPVGLLIGRMLAFMIIEFMFDLEIMRFPVVIYPSTYVYAAVVVLCAAAISALIVRRRLDRLDLVGVLKARD